MPMFVLDAPRGTKFLMYKHHQGGLAIGIRFAHGNEDKVREGLLKQLEPETFFKAEKRMAERRAVHQARHAEERNSKIESIRNRQLDRDAKEKERLDRRAKRLAAKNTEPETNEIENDKDEGNHGESQADE